MSRGQGRLYRRKGTANWWLDYSIRGARHLESSGTASRKEAVDLLRQRIGQRTEGRLVGRPERVVFAEYGKDEHGEQKLVGGLRASLERHYQQRANRSLTRARQALGHLEHFLGGTTPALAITKQRMGDYLAHRLAAGAARATVRYEIAVLNVAYSVAVEEGLLAVRPMFKLPAVENARSGFFEDGDVAALLVELPAYLRAPVQFARLTGWRREEVLGLTWDAVDWEGRVIRLAAKDTKGGAARLFPFGSAPELKRLLDERWAARDGVCVFHRAGRRIGNFRKAWASATQRAGLAGRIFHDLRRTAARDLRRAGVSEGEIMRLCGWATRAMFDRYNIIDEADLAAAVAKRFGANDTVAGQKTPSQAPSEAPLPG